MKLDLLVLGIFVYSLYLISGEIGKGMVELKRWDRATKQVESIKAIAERSCASTFTFSFDRDSFVLGTELTTLESNGMYGYCADTFSAINDLCLDSDYQLSISNIKSVSCTFDKDIIQPNTSFKAGHLQLTFNWDTSNHKTTVQKYLKNTL